MVNEAQTYISFKLTSNFKSETFPYVIDVPCGSVLPAEVDQGVVGLLDVHQALAFVRCDRVPLQAHFTSPKLHQVLAGASPRAADQARKQSARRHPRRASRR